MSSQLNLDEIKKTVKEHRLPIRDLMKAIGFNGVSYYDSIKRKDFKSSVLLRLANYVNKDVRLFFNNKTDDKFDNVYILEERIKYLEEINMLLKDKIEYISKEKKQ